MLMHYSKLSYFEFVLHNELFIRPKRLSGFESVVVLKCEGAHGRMEKYTKSGHYS